MVARIKAPVVDVFDQPVEAEEVIPEIDVQSLQPQPGPQTKFAQCQADIAIFGGAAGGGKSYALIMEPMRNVYRSGKYAAVIFRRTTPSITHPGSLWDTSSEIYGQTPGARQYESAPLHWEWDGGPDWEAGAKVQFSHLEHEKTVRDWHGSQIPFIGFDELTEFTQYQFWYMLSRNRSTSGVKPYMRCTCNADADSWVAELIAWWIDQETGFPIKERDGVVRYFIRIGDELKWADTVDELTPERLGIPRFTEDGKENQYLVKSLTFIAANVYDNKILMATNPEYMGSLLSLPKVERERLLGGNWKIKPAAGLHFNRSWVEVIDRNAVPTGLTWKRGWDLAATEKTQVNDPDFTTCTLIGKDTVGSDPFTYVADHQYAQESSFKVEKRMKNVASQDGPDVEQNFPQDPGAAGKTDVTHKKQLLDGYTSASSTEKGDKIKRFGPFSSQAEAGFVKVVRDYDIVDGQKVFWSGHAWNERWFQQLEAFPDGGHDDDVDSTSRAFNAFINATTGMLDWMRSKAAEVKKQYQESIAPLEKPDKNNGGVCFKGPSGVNVLYDMKGRALTPNADGFFFVSQEHAKFLRKPGSGFTEV